jgi:hypothetical protein
MFSHQVDNKKVLFNLICQAAKEKGEIQPLLYSIKYDVDGQAFEALTLFSKTGGQRISRVFIALLF